MNCAIAPSAAICSSAGNPGIRPAPADSRQDLSETAARDVDERQICGGAGAMSGGAKTAQSEAPRCPPYWRERPVRDRSRSCSRRRCRDRTCPPYPRRRRGGNTTRRLDRERHERPVAGMPPADRPPTGAPGVRIVVVFGEQLTRERRRLHQRLFRGGAFAGNRAAGYAALIGNGGCRSARSNTKRRSPCFVACDRVTRFSARDRHEARRRRRIASEIVPDCWKYQRSPGRRVERGRG
jgi:hypothetical protein